MDLLPCPHCADMQHRINALTETLEAIAGTAKNGIEMASAAAPPLPLDMDVLDEAFDGTAMSAFLAELQTSEIAARAFINLSPAQRERLTVTELRSIAQQLQLPYTGTKTAMIASMLRFANSKLRAVADSEAFLKASEQSCVSTDPLP